MGTLPTQTEGSSRGFSNLLSLSTEDLIKKNNEVQLNWEQYFIMGCSSALYRHLEILGGKFIELGTYLKMKCTDAGM